MNEDQQEELALEYFQRAYAHQMNGELDEAVGYYCFPHYNLGRIYERKHQWSKAVECYRDSLSHNPDYSLAKSALRRLQTKWN